MGKWHLDEFDRAYLPTAGGFGHQHGLFFGMIDLQPYGGLQGPRKQFAGGSQEQKLPVDGKDVWPLLTQGAPSPHDAVLCVQSPTQAALRMGDWKLISNAGGAGNPAKGKAKKKAQLFSRRRHGWSL